MDNSPRPASIHILDDDSLLHVFYLYRPFLLGEDENDDDRLWGGIKGWDRGRWWYKLAHVCQRWRNILFGSALYLELSLVCTYGTPVADMLAHSPPFPLVLEYVEIGRDITINDEDGIILALKQRGRVLRVRLFNVTSLQKFIAAMDEEYPILEYLVTGLPRIGTIGTMFPETLQAPHLRHLTLYGITLPIGSRLLTNAVGLVTLYLIIADPSTYFHPNTLLQWILLMPQLETLGIIMASPIPDSDVARHTPIIAPFTLPNLRDFRFTGVTTYLETLVHRITAPRLEKLKIDFFNQLTVSAPRLLQFMNTAENLKFDSASFNFSDKRVDAVIYPHGEFEMYALGIVVYCWHLDWQVSSMIQISSLLSQMFSVVEHLTLLHEEHSQSSEEHNQVDRTEWRRLLSPFRNVKTLLIGDGLVEDLSRCLELGDGELPLELLPELQELTYSGSGDAFTSFIDARQNTDRPISLVRRSPSPSPDQRSSVSITQASNEAGGGLDTP
jgi:hypothetical protein